jgi:hypothetical protein
MVVVQPPLSAEISPSAKITMFTEFRIGFIRSFLNLGEEPLFQGAEIPRIVGVPEALSLSASEKEMHHRRIQFLYAGHELRIEAELDNIFGFGGAGQLCVNDFITMATQSGWSRNPLQEIGVSDKGSTGEGGLVDNLHAGTHGLDSFLHGRIRVAIIQGYINKTRAMQFEIFQVSLFMGYTFGLEKQGFFVIFHPRQGRFEIYAVKRCQVLATEKIGNVTSGIKNQAVFLLHGVQSSCMN